MKFSFRLESVLVALIIVVLAYNQFLLSQIKSEGSPIALKQEAKKEFESTMQPTTPDLELMKAGVGAPGTQHIHADFAVYVNGQRLDLRDTKYVMKSALIHLDKRPNPEDQGGVLHIHATNISFVAFLRSIGMDLTETCLTLEEKEQKCVDDENSLLLYVNGELVAPVTSYIPKDKDKILLTYGDLTDQQELFREIDSIPDFAKDY